jgi:hypothetical protein
MESIYYVMCWACHRKCKHCYEDRFRPYRHDELGPVVAEARANFPRIIENLPERLTFLDPDDCDEAGRPREKIGRVILSGGECLIDPVRTDVTYKVIDLLNEKYRAQGGVRIVIQTTGDILTPAILNDLLERGVYKFSIASTDRFHIGLDTPEKQQRFVAGLTEMFESFGVRSSDVSPGINRRWHDEVGPLFNVFGATEGSWIGKIWPRGRGWDNGLSSATLADNFCNRASGGLAFLNHRHAGSEVSIEPDGSVYPCCVKTKLPIGSLLEDNLIDILDSLADEPAYQAINHGDPVRMGVSHGWSPERFLAESKTVTPKGEPYQNLCIGCDRFHEQVLGAVIEQARERRRLNRLADVA